MQGLKLEINQKSACYRIPTTSGIWLSYPLPPYSTVYGFLRAICRQSEETEQSINYKNTKLAISGSHQTSFFDLQTMHREDMKSKQGITEPYKIQHLYHVKLSIYIISDEMRLNLVEKGLKNPPFSFSLGRKEDLITKLNFNRVEIIESEADEMDDVVGNKNFLPIYIPKEIAEKYDLRDEHGTINGIYFKIPLDSYFLRDYNLRRMIYQKTIYFAENPIYYIGGEKIYADRENETIVWI